MINVYRRAGSPFWWADLRSVGLGRISTKRRVKREAREVADRMYREALDRRQLGIKDELTIKDALDRYIGGLEPGSHKDGRSRARDKLLGLGSWAGRTHFRWDPAMLMSDLTTAMVTDLQSRRRAEGMGQSAINHETKMLQRAHRLCQLDWEVQVRPDVRFPVGKAPEKKRRLTDAEEQRLLAELDPRRPLKSVPNEPGNPRRMQMQDVYDLTLLFLDTGCRPSEGSTIAWDQVSLQEETLQLFRDKVDNEGLIGMTPRVKEMLMRRRSMYPGARYVFPRWDRQKVDLLRPRAGSQSLRSLSRAIERAKINDDPVTVKRYGKFTPHSCRDTFCSRVIERGLSTAGARDLLGHATDNMTKKYTHLGSRDLAKKAAELLS